jgi:hypothetical protein
LPTEKELPIRTNDLTLTAEAKFSICKTLIPLPHRPRPRADKELPKNNAFKTEPEPMRQLEFLPQTLMELPHLEKLRTLRDEPSDKNETTEVAAHNAMRVFPDLRETEDPR